MTVTVKLDASLEQQLREHVAAKGCTASEVIRAALSAYLAADEVPRSRSAWSLGEDLFGRYAAQPDLAVRRKQLLAEAWSAKARRR